MWSNATRVCRRCGSRYYRNEPACTRCPTRDNDTADPGRFGLETERPAWFGNRVGSLQYLQGERAIGDGVLRRAIDSTTFEPATVWLFEANREHGPQWLSRFEQAQHPFAFSPAPVITLSSTRDWSQLAAATSGTPSTSLGTMQASVAAPHALSLSLSLASAMRAFLARGIDCARVAPHAVLIDHAQSSTARLLPGRAPSQRTRVVSSFDEPALHQMAPEAFSERGTSSFDGCAQYALGSVLFRLLTGRTAFEGEPMQVVVQKRREAAPDARSFDPTIPEALSRIVAVLVARAPSDRYASIEHAIDALLSDGKELVAEHESAQDLRPFEARVGAPDLRRFARVEHMTGAMHADDPAAVWEALFARGFLPERWIDTSRRSFAHRRCGQCVNASTSLDCPLCFGTRWSKIESSPRTITDALMFAACAAQVEATESLALEVVRGFMKSSTALQSVRGAISRVVWEPVDPAAPPPFVFSLRETWGTQPYTEDPDEFTIPSNAPMWWRRLAVAARKGSVGEVRTVGIEQAHWRALRELLAQGFILCGAAGSTLSLGFRPLATSGAVDSR